MIENPLLLGDDMTGLIGQIIDFEHDASTSFPNYSDPHFFAKTFGIR